MSEDLRIALVSALVGGGLSMSGVFLQHVLSLREDSIKRQRDEIYQRAEELRKQLLAGTREAAERRAYE